MEQTKTLENLDDLLVSEIQHLYATKEEMATLLPKVIQHISDRELRKVFISLKDIAAIQKERLEQIGLKFNIELEGHECKSILGLVAESNDMMAMETTPDIMDAGLLANFQRIVNFELAGYHTVCNYAYILGYEEVGNLLHDTLKEKMNAQEHLSNLATGKINERAL
jgi:ferritin-like metal-binding protein YciE